MNSISTKDVCLEYGGTDCSLDRSGFVSVTDVISDVIFEIRYRWKTSRILIHILIFPSRNKIPKNNTLSKNTNEETQ